MVNICETFGTVESISLCFLRLLFASKGNSIGVPRATLMLQLHEGNEDASFAEESSTPIISHNAQQTGRWRRPYDECSSISEIG